MGEYVPAGGKVSFVRVVARGSIIGYNCTGIVPTGRARGNIVVLNLRSMKEESIGVFVAQELEQAGF